MNSQTQIALLIVAGLIVITLAGYALYLYVQLRRKTAERKQQEELLVEEIESRRKNHRNSIRVIASAIVQGQVGLTEGAIRISMLVSQLGLSDLEKADYQVFFQLTEATSHIPILEEWKKLNKKEKLSFDQEREELEASFKAFIEVAANKLLISDGSEVTNNEPLFYSVGKE
jgi:Protein of unknown function (DUF2489)